MNQVLKISFISLCYDKFYNYKNEISLLNMFAVFENDLIESTSKKFWAKPDQMRSVLNHFELEGVERLTFLVWLTALDKKSYYPLPLLALSAKLANQILNWTDR